MGLSRGGEIIIISLLLVQGAAGADYYNYSYNYNQNQSWEQK